MPQPVGEGHTSERADVVVVGAGLAGLCAAGRLVRAGRQVVVLDKGRGPGGRLATRRLDDDGAVADHGAQFFTVREPEFSSLIQDWPVEIWHHGPARAAAVTARASLRVGTDGHPRFRGTTGMSGIAKHLARTLDVRLGVRVHSVSPDHDGWIVQADDGTSLSAASVIVTSPVPQTIDMVSIPLPEDVTSLTYDPTIALLATLDGPAGLPDPGAIEFDGGDVHYLTDNQAKGIATRPTITVHADADWSRRHFADTDVNTSRALGEMVRPWLAAEIASSQIKRWRYAAPTSPHTDPAVQPAPGLVLAGDTFGAAKVEGASLSGLAAASLLLR